MKANHRTCKSYPKGRTQAKCSEASTNQPLPANYPASKIPKLQNQSEKCYAIKFPYKLPKLPSQKWCKLPPAPLLQTYHCCHRRQCCPCCKLPEKSNRRPLALRNINYRHDAVLCPTLPMGTGHWTASPCTMQVELQKPDAAATTITMSNHVPAHHQIN